MKISRLGFPLFMTLNQLACTAAETTDDAAASEAIISSVGTLELEAIDKIVGVTDPVIAFASSDTSSSAVASRNFDQLIIGSGFNLASQGVSLGDSATKINSAFNSANGSKAFCETVNNGMKFFKEASDPDFNLCILKGATAGSTIKAAGFQVWDFKGSSPMGTFTYRMKFSLDANEDGSLKQFESFTCMAMGSMALTQSGYALQTITDGKLAIHTRAQSSMGVEPVKLRVDVAANVNADGRPVGLKTIDYAEKTATRSVHTKVTQSAENIQAIGYENSSGRLTQYLSFVELLDSNAATGQYYITKIAYGDGAALTKISENGATSSNTSSWNGDTLVLDSNQVRRTKVVGREAELITSTGDSIDVEFTAAETYDCSGTADQTFTAAGAEDPSGCMAAFDIDQNGSQLCTSLNY